MITDLIVRDCIYLKQKGVSHVELNLRELLNFILGRNGFGKTTLMRLISPLPPDNADFGPDGYKEWRFADDRGTFVLKSKTGKNSHHEFIHNGKNLNEGNTLLVQRELVKIHFGITQQIVNVLTGLDARDLFTMMPPNRRKEFLMLVNPNDTSYALKVFDKLKSNYNAIRGGLKTQRQRLVVEENRLKDLAAMDSEQLRKEIDGLDSQIKDALVIHGRLSNVHHVDIKPLVEQMKNAISRLIGNDNRIKLTAGEYTQTVDILTARLANRNHYITKLSTVHAEITSQLQGLDVSTQNLEGYKKRVEMIEQTLENTKSSIELIEYFFTDHPIFQENEYYRSDAIVKHGSELIEQLRLVHKARDPEATSEKFKQIQEKLVSYRNELANTEAELNQIAHHLKHFNSAESVACPECETKFKIGFEKFNPQELENRRDMLSDAKKGLLAKINRCEDYIDANEEWYSSMQGFMRYLRRLHEADQLMPLIQKYNIGKSEVTILVECLKRAVQLDKMLKQFSQLEEEKFNLENQIKFLESSDVNSLFLRAEEVEREMAITQREIGRIREDIKKTQNYLDIIRDDEVVRDNLAALKITIMERLEENGMYKIKLKVQEAIDDMSPRKEQLMSNLIRAESLNSVIESIKEHIAYLEEREKHTLLLMDGLSPVKGFIGYLMNDFLKAVVANMNSIIQQIWTTRFRMLNCSTSKTEDDVDLNYLFPAFTGEGDKPAKDIAECSAGEREIINFVFRLVILRYLGPKCGIPLMMDEVGVQLDELHKGRFYSWVEEQYRVDTLPKTIAISHNYAQFGSNHSANFIGLNTEGLNVPSNMNIRSIIR